MPQYKEILDKINQSIDRFNRKIPATQKSVLDAIEEDLRALDLVNGRIKATVKNLSKIASVKNRLLKIILTDDYKEEVKEFARAFNDITALQNDYWREVEVNFEPRPLLKAVKKQAIEDTVGKLMESGISANVADPISDILRQNITTGGSYRSLTDQLKEFLTKTETPGGLEKYAKQITTDSLNQYSAQYTQIVSSDLGYEWFKYDNTDIETTRPWCDAMTDRKFFHVSEIPALLRAEGLTYVNKKGQRVPVPIYDKTGLPHGMMPGTDASNIFVRRGGYNCGHQIRPVSESLVQQAAPDVVFNVKQPQEKKFETAKQIRFNAELANKQKKDSFMFYRDPETGAFTKERQKMQETLVRDYLANGSSKEGTAYLLGGAPASGKSVLTNSGRIPFPKEILVVDADKVKSMIPDYDQMVKDKNNLAANFVHEESSMLGKEIVARSLAKNYDVVLDGVGDGEYNSLVSKIQKFKDAGKRTRADYVTCDTDLTVDRAMARAAKTGREVPKKYILDMNREISKLVPQLVKNKVFDELYLWDTNDPKGARLILTQINGKLSIKDQDLYNRFLRKQNE